MSDLLVRRERGILVSVVVLMSLLAPLFLMPGASAITWGPIEEISEDKRIEYQRYPAIAADAGKAYAVWADNGDRDYDIFLREHDGAAWQLEEELNNGDNSVDQWLPDVAVEGSTVHTVWQDPISGDWDIMYRSRSGGVLGPVTEISVDIGIETQQYPRVAVSGDIVHVVWQDGRDGDWDVYYRFHDGVSWSTVQELSADVGSEAQTFPCIAAGGGRVYVVWVDAGGGDTDIVMKVFNGVSWGAITEVSQDSANEAQDEPDISYDSGKLHVVWQEVQGTDKDIFHRSWDGSTFSSITEISIDSGTEFQDVPSVAAEFGKVHTVWADRGDGDWDIVYRQFDGSSWTAIQEISGDGASENQWNPYVASDNGVVHVVWEDQGDGDQDIFYRRGFEAPPVDITPPDVLNVLLDGMPAQTYPMSSLPATVSLTATMDDSARGNSVIGGANFTIGPQNWPKSTMMVPDDFLDSSVEGFHFDVVPPITMGTWQYCVYGWDIVPNDNTIGSCATLTIIDDLPPLVVNVLIDGFAIRTIPAGTPSVSLTGTLDDSSTGNSNIGGANYTSPQKNWLNSSLMIADDILDSPIEGFHSTIGTSTLGFGSYETCVYGWDVIPNYNSNGACATLNVAVDTQPPLVTNVLINGQPSFSFGISSIPSLTLTATIDDSTTGGSNIGGANFTLGPQNWPTSTPMTPDNVLDTSVEGFNVALDGFSFLIGVYQVCVYGWDEIPNYNILGSCADLTVLDDLAPVVRDVLIDGLAVQVILEGSPNVQLTATVDDTSTGSSLVGGANYTNGPAAFPGTAMNPVNPPLDSSLEDFAATVPTGALTSGTYTFCVYGWDDVPNNNLTDTCATLIVALETEPPAILNVLINGMTSASFGLSSIPVLTLTADMDDSATGNSVIGGANYTSGTANWPTATLMAPDDVLDTSVEGFHSSLAQPSNPGSWQYCVYGWDAIPNYNLTGSCAGLTVFDDIPPDVGGVLIDGVPVRNIVEGTPSVTLIATVDDSMTGGSIIAGANFTSPSQDWANSTPMIPDDSLDSVLEGFHAPVDTSSLSVGSYVLCAYGWDEAFNNNTAGSCATLIVDSPGAIDTTPPEITSVLIGGASPQTFFLSTLPPSFLLTAVVDDSATGNSIIGGANFTIGPQNWPTSTMMIPDDLLDSPTEGFNLDVVLPAATGSWQYCVYGWDIVPNDNTTGSCATLTILDDLAPLVDNVLIDGLPVRNIAEGTLSITLFATVDDLVNGASIIAGANFTSPSQNWANATTMIPDDSLDSATEGFHAPVDTSSLSVGSYVLCAYGSDEAFNNNTVGLCSTLIVNPPGAIDSQPPEILDVLIDGSSSQMYFLSSLSPFFILTAIVDDTLTGASLIASANRTLGPGGWPGVSMSPADGAWNEVMEDVDATVSTPSLPGTYTYCVYGSDQEGNHNTTGGCAMIDIVDDLPPAISNVRLDGLASKTILVGTPSVTLTASVDDSLTGGSTIGGANLTSPSLSWGNSTMMAPSLPPLDSSNEVFEFVIDTSNIPEGTYEIWVYGWDAPNNLNITPSEHAILYVVPVAVVDNPPNVEIVAIHPKEVEEGETVSVIISVNDDGSVDEVRVEVTGPGGVVVDNVTVDYDTAHGGYVAELSYGQSGIYNIIVWARDDGGNWASSDGSFEVLESAPAEQANYKPVLALVFAVILLLVGLLVLFKMDVDNKMKKYWFLPFAIAEGITGGVSAATGALSIPPVAGAGLAVDLLILLMGLSIPLLLLIKKPFQTDEGEDGNE